MNTLIKRGNNVKVFSTANYGEVITDQYKHLFDELVVYRECYHKWERYIFFTKQNRIYKQLIKSYNVNDFDLLHSHNLFTGGYAAYKASEKFGVPFVVSIRSTDVNVFMKFGIFRKLALKIVKSAGGLVFLSNVYRDEFIRKFIPEDLKKTVAEKSVVAPNGLEPFWLENYGKQRELDNKKKVKLFFAGKIDRNKNITTTMKVVEELRKRGIDAQFTVVARVLDEKLLEEIKSSPLVEYMPYVPKERLIELYREHDIYVMPSFTETFGRAYVEAMTQGLPVIFTKGQGFDGFFSQGEVGYAINPNDVNDITDSIIKIMNNYSDISKRCIKEAARFNWETSAETIENCYKKALKK